MKENPGGLLYEKIRVDYYTQSALIFPRGKNNPPILQPFMS